jgi:4-hydroxy-4-methyl-2-oxoglutarate aldolase
VNRIVKGREARGRGAALAGGPAGLSERFGAIYTGAITDVLDGLGREHQTLPSSIVPLSPGMRVAGPVFSVEGRQRAMDREPSIRRILEMLGSIPPGHVAVYEPNDDSCAHFGELSATALESRRVAGVVINGGCRDVELVRETGLPVFSRYSTPQDAVPRWEVLEWGSEVTIEGVRAATGDYVVGDADGVVVIPAGLVVEVLERSEAVVATESSVRDAVRSGMAPLDAYAMFGKF